MTKNLWEGSLRSFRSHFDPEKEEQLKWMRIEIENNVKKILKLTKSINGNKDGNSKKKSELIHLIEDFHQQYESLYSWYEDIRAAVKNNASDGGYGGPLTPASDSESYFSPDESSVRGSDTPGEIPNALYTDDQMPETSEEEEDAILKDKLTSSSEVKEVTTSRSQSPADTEILKDLTVSTDNIRQRSDQVKELKGEVASSNEAKHMEEKGSLQLPEDKEKGYIFRISDLVAQTNILQLQVDKLQHQNIELEERLLSNSKEASSQEKGLKEQVKSLQKELSSVNSKKAELDLFLKKKSAEASEFCLQIENLRKELTDLGLTEKATVEENEKFKAQVQDLDLRIHSLTSEKRDLQEQITKTNHEAQELRGKLSALQASLSESENELSAHQKRFKACQSELSAQIKSLNDKVRKHENTLEALQNERNRLQAELRAQRDEKKQYQTELEKERQESLQRKSQMEKKNTELTNKIADQQKTLLELGDAMTKLKAENDKSQIRIVDSKSSFQFVERKMEEMAEEFRKQFEDKYRILSRRIRVAEQLQVESKEWYLKTRNDLKEWVDRSETEFMNLKDMSSTANDVLALQDKLALKFEECNAHFLNRISKASCELKFAKDWATRKNRAQVHVKKELDILLSQLDDKESEILVFREKVWKSENKVREMEKLIKEKEEGMLVLKEEKREAIRQLCVWIDYHRSRSDYYKKVLCELNPGRRKAS